ncbi:hypothetical protein MCOR25_009929 [Pyricularia grisea]|nr:hypothetical protein MCOR25_009929 [Pyricularia grisea]
MVYRMMVIYGVRNLFMGSAIFSASLNGHTSTLGWLLASVGAVTFTDGFVCGKGEWNHWGFVPIATGTGALLLGFTIEFGEVPQLVGTLDETLLDWNIFFNKLTRTYQFPPTDETVTVEEVFLEMFWLRIYTPKAKITVRTTPLPVAVYFHGGVFAMGCVDLEECLLPPSQHISSDPHRECVEYRLAPCCKFPAALEDTIAAADWPLSNPPPLGPPGTKASSSQAPHPAATWPWVRHCISPSTAAGTTKSAMHDWPDAYGLPSPRDPRLSRLVHPNLGALKGKCSV